MNDVRAVHEMLCALCRLGPGEMEMGLGIHGEPVSRP